MARRERDIDRRSVILLGCTSALAAAMPACARKKEEEHATTKAASSSTAVGSTSGAGAPNVAVPVSSGIVRVASVSTAVDGDLLPTLIAEFEKQSPSLKVSLTTTSELYDIAREGKVDLAISHFGHKHAEAFVMDGFGEFPRTLFSNQMALVGPPSDPAKVRDLTDVVDAFRRIAHSKSPFVLNGSDGVRYLVDVLWNSIGKPSKDGWFIDDGSRNDEAIRIASERGAYSFWGLTPFLRSDKAAHLKLEPLVVADPLLQRMLVSIIVRPSKVAGVNEDGARKFQNFLLSPATQAKIREVRYPGAHAVHWVPAGRHNRTAVLPRG